MAYGHLFTPVCDIYSIPNVMSLMKVSQVFAKNKQQKDIGVFL